jgi:CheY-like chemotaxis protein
MTLSSEEADVPPRRGHILIVEDEADIREALRETLEHEGYQVHEAANGVDAVNVLWKLHREKRLPDLILLDVMMPQKDGLEFYREIRGIGNFTHIHVVVMSARRYLDRHAEAEDLRGLARLEKPFDERSLLEAVHRYLGG